MSIAKHTTGLILAGGRGTRMGSVDKGLLPFRGTTLAGHVLQRLAPQVAGVVISANRNLALYAALGVPVQADELAGYAGPLAGLETALRHCATDYLLSVPCDSPLLPADLLARLAAALAGQDADVALAVTSETDASGTTYRQKHPVFCLLKRSALATLSAYLQAGGRRMDGWYAPLNVVEVLFDDADAFRNVNTPQELHAVVSASQGGAGNAPSADTASNPAETAALSVNAARALIQDSVAIVQASERVALRSGLDRVLAEDIISPINVPAYDNSAMDGYALRGADLREDGPTTLAIAGITYAGRPTDVRVGPGQCIRIMTGGLMPEGCDTVVAQERVAAADASAITLAPGTLRAGANRRLAGEDLQAGAPALRQGKIIRPADLGLMASLGIAEVPVRRRLRVAFFSTGDELRSIGEPLGQGCVYDSNRYTLFGMLTRLGCDLIDMGVVKDEPAALKHALQIACESADAIITSGGVSAGAADYTRHIMAELGDVAFWNIDMRPGRPMAFGKIHSNGRSAFLFGLPGNPVAVMVSFYFLTRPALLRMMGADATLPMLRVTSPAPIGKKAGRTEFQRGIISRDAQGAPQVHLTGAQGSGILRSMAEANCMVVLDAQQGNVEAGAMVDVLLFEGLV